MIIGSSSTVSVGGYVTGGGHGILSGQYGLAADAVLEMEIVTPGGQILVANECQNQDLFWANRGVIITFLFGPKRANQIDQVLTNTHSREAAQPLAS
jgi:FAD/FMN-containing dehydrogenase